MHKRENNLVTRLDDEEIAMMHALSEATDEPMTRIVRRLIRTAYVDRFGIGRPPAQTARASNVASRERPGVQGKRGR
jgi:hypothetical protein